MILIPEQIRILKEKKIRLEKELATIDNYRDSEDKTIGEESRNYGGKDYITNDTFSRIRNELSQINDTLQNGVYLKERCLDKIDIGTKFSFQFIDEEEIYNFTLVDTSLGLNSIDGFISKDSPLGQKCIGKKDFSTIENTGIILEIKKAYDDYLHYIREKGHIDRMSKEEKRKKSQLRSQMEISESAKKEYEKYQMITPSQKELLQQEQIRLMFGKLDKKTKARLWTIKKILEERQVITPNEEDDTIQIGSRFSMLTYDDEGVKIERKEMINYAVSDEFVSDYVEKISPMGCKIFGLKNNEEFIYRKGNQYFSGVVFDIDNSKDQIKTNSALTYQKTSCKK